MASFEGFPKDTIRFLTDLKKNNNRPWFAENKQRYESSFLEPAFELIRSLQKPLSKSAPLLEAEAKKVGGSLMRIYKDTRFSKDKTPYKTNMGIHFRHKAGKGVHTPGVYLHVAPDECFLGAGIWRPPSDALRQIREHLDANPTEWRKIAKNKTFNQLFTLHDDRLKSAPRGFDKEHPLVDDLKLKSFIGLANLSRTQIESKELLKTIEQHIKAAKPIMIFLCEALGQPY